MIISNWTKQHLVSIHKYFNVVQVKSVMPCSIIMFIWGIFKMCFVLGAGALWTCVVLNPNYSSSEKSSWHRQLRHWSHMDVCPLEDADNRLVQPGGVSSPGAGQFYHRCDIIKHNCDNYPGFVQLNTSVSDVDNLWRNPNVYRESIILMVILHHRSIYVYKNTAYYALWQSMET